MTVTDRVSGRCGPRRAKWPWPAARRSRAAPARGSTTSSRPSPSPRSGPPPRAGHRFAARPRGAPPGLLVRGPRRSPRRARGARRRPPHSADLLPGPGPSGRGRPGDAARRRRGPAKGLRVASSPSFPGADTPWSSRSRTIRSTSFWPSSPASARGRGPGASQRAGRRNLVKPIYIAAYQQSKFGKLLGMTVPEILRRAAEETCTSVKAERRPSTSPRSAPSATYAQRAGAPFRAPRDDSRASKASRSRAVENACATGGQAILAVASKLMLGEGDVGLAVGFEKMRDAEGKIDGKLDREGPRLLLPSRRAGRQDVRLPAPLRRGDEGLHGRLGRHRGGLRARSPRRSTRTPARTRSPRCRRTR